jgi:diguanylate cyclase (GGDEF)-like protein/PAS domain S-box-containing protein
VPPEREPADSAGGGRAGLETPEQQVALWRLILSARYIVLGTIALATLLPQVGVRQVDVTLALIFIALPYNGIYDYLLRRTNVLYPTLAYSDQVLAVGFLALAPSQLAVVLLFMSAINATAVVAFGRRIAAQASIVGFVGVCLVAGIRLSTDAVAPLIAYGVLAAFTIVGVGLIAERERELRWRYTELMGGIDAIVWEQLTQHPSTLYVNEEAANLLGYPASDWLEPGMWSRVVHPDDQRTLRRAYREAIRKGESRELEYRMLAADGSVVHVHDRMRVETDSIGRATRVRGVMLDTTATKQAQAKANQFVNLVDGIKMALFVFGLEDVGDDDSLRVLAINPEAAHLAGIDQEKAVGELFLDAIDLPDRDLLLGNLCDVIRTGQTFSVDEFRMQPQTRSGRVYSAHAFPLPGDAVGLSLHDVTERTMAAEVLRRQALHDGLTGLPNRTMLHERLRAALLGSEQSGSRVGLLVMDLDQFKDVNDALGHDQGDRLLIEMSRRLQRVLRGAHTIARLGGDEFALLVTDVGDADGALYVAHQVRRALEQPFQLGGISLQTSASIGVALYPDHATNAEALIQRADVAMYAAKRGGLGTAVYTPEADQSSVRRLALLGELRGAIQADDLVLHYQPSLDLTNGEVHSAEALVRWQHPEHGLMPPAEFIELAEVSGLIQPMTRWIIEAALTQIRAWLDQGLEIQVSVNLSVRNLYDRDLVPWLDRLLIDRGIGAKLLKLEVTESELMDDPLLALEVLGKLRALGLSTSIDDFGTGYSSLAYLKHLPIDELKIDRSFVNAMVEDASDLTIVRSTIDLSHNLGLEVVAEGVEDGETLHLLAELGCDRAQGYFVSRPVPADVFTEWVRAPERLAEARGHLVANGIG